MIILPDKLKFYSADLCCIADKASNVNYHSIVYGLYDNSIRFLYSVNDTIINYNDSSDNQYGIVSDYRYIFNNDNFIFNRTIYKTNDYHYVLHNIRAVPKHDTAMITTGTRLNITNQCDISNQIDSNDLSVTNYVWLRNHMHGLYLLIDDDWLHYHQ